MAYIRPNGVTKNAANQRGEQGLVGPVEAGLGVGSAEYRDLVAQDEELGRLYGPAGACSYRPRCPHPCWRKRSGHLDQGVVFRARALYHRWLRWSWWEASVANYSFLVHAPRPLIDALIRTARRLASSRALCRGVGAAA
jgi:hypothetical protein